LFAILAIGFATSGVQAGPVYQWVNEAGVTQFSDTPPTDDVADVSELSYVTPPTAVDPAEDYWSVTNQLERMQAARLAEAASYPRQVTRITHITVQPDPPPVRHIISYSIPSRIYRGRSYIGRGRGDRYHDHQHYNRGHEFNARYSGSGFSFGINSGLRAGRHSPM
jgi:hypothetical protein